MPGAPPGLGGPGAPGAPGGAPTGAPPGPAVPGGGPPARAGTPPGGAGTVPPVSNERRPGLQYNVTSVQQGDVVRRITAGVSREEDPVRGWVMIGGENPTVRWPDGIRETPVEELEITLAAATRNDFDAMADSIIEANVDSEVDGKSTFLSEAGEDDILLKPNEELVDEGTANERIVAKRSAKQDLETPDEKKQKRFSFIDPSAEPLESEPEDTED